MATNQDDHYVSQTYLSQFIDSTKPGYLNVYRKKYPKTSKYRTPRQICYEPNGDRNSYFPKIPRVLDEILRLVEPEWNSVIRKLEEGVYSLENKKIVALYVAYLLSCTKTAKRLGKSVLDYNLENLHPLFVEHIKGNTDKYEESEKLIDALLSPDVKARFNPEFSHALAIEILPKLGLTLFRLPWLIIKNISSKPFLTSDNPATLVYFPNKEEPGIYVPLSPKLGILVLPYPHNNSSDYSSISKAGHEAVEKFNSELIKGAESLIISNIQSNWISELIEKHKKYEIVVENIKVASDSSSSIYQYRQRAVLST